MGWVTEREHGKSRAEQEILKNYIQGDNRALRKRMKERGDVLKEKL